MIRVYGWQRKMRTSFASLSAVVMVFTVATVVVNRLQFEVSDNQKQVRLLYAGDVQGTELEHPTANYTSKVDSVEKPGNSPQFKIGKTKNEKDHKIILWYFRPNYIKPTRDGELRPLSACPDLPCKETSDAALFSKADAVVFDVHTKIQAKTAPKKYPNQLWVFYAQEAPPRTKWWVYKRPEWKGAFNWTCTYRRDSDVFMPYGIIKKNPNPPTNKNYKSIAAGKTKMAAWIVSHCDVASKRMEFAKELEKHGVKLDVFGGCGKFKCPDRSAHGHDVCEAAATTNYSFYYAFENTLCVDYITEKFFAYFKRDVIVVTRGGLGLSNNFPNGTFIRAEDYNSTKQLAAYMKHLHWDRGAYVSFLKRKDEYISESEIFAYLLQKTNQTYTHHHYLSEPVCDMCRKLLDSENNKNHYSDIYKWYYEGACKDPADLQKN